MRPGEGLDDGEEVVDHPDEPSSARTSKQKRRKKPRLPLPEPADSPAWPWWAFGGGGAFLIMFILLCLTVLSPSGSLGKVIAAYLLIAIPLSTVTFFGAMYLSSVMAGAIEIGEVHIAVVKSFYLVVIVSLVSLIPFGRFLTILVWIAGLMSFFRLDIWEAKVLFAFNWVLNFIVQLFVFAAIVSLVQYGGSRHDNRAGWDELDVEERGGSVEYDPANPDADIVIGISFRDGRLTDADLTHMKDFPRLVKLDLTNTPVTDAGLAQLKPCKGLQVLILTGTQVTDAGVHELQAALPHLRIVR